MVGFSEVLSFLHCREENEDECDDDEGGRVPGGRGPGGSGPGGRGPYGRGPGGRGSASRGSFGGRPFGRGQGGRGSFGRRPAGRGPGAPMPGYGERPEPPAELLEALQAKITELDTRDAAGCFDSLDSAFRFFGGNLQIDTNKYLY